MSSFLGLPHDVEREQRTSWTAGLDSLSEDWRRERGNCWREGGVPSSVGEGVTGSGIEELKGLRVSREGEVGTCGKMGSVGGTWSRGSCETRGCDGRGVERCSSSNPAI